MSKYDVDDILNLVFQRHPPRSNAMIGGFGFCAPPMRNALVDALLGESRSYSDEERREIAWQRTAQFASDMSLLDCDNRLIFKDEYGKNTEYGWHVDHIIPLAEGGPDVPSNWRARHWRGNCSAGGYLGFYRRQAAR